MEPGIFGMVAVSEIEELGFVVDVPSSVVIIVSVAECDHRVRVTPPIDMLPLFENDYL